MVHLGRLGPPLLTASCCLGSATCLSAAGAAAAAAAAAAAVGIRLLLGAVLLLVGSDGGRRPRLGDEQQAVGCRAAQQVPPHAAQRALVLPARSA